MWAKNSKSGKIAKPFFRYNLVMLILFPEFWKTFSGKKTQIQIFMSRKKNSKKYFCMFMSELVSESGNFLLLLPYDHKSSNE